MNRYREITGKINYIMFIVGAALLPYPQIALRYAYTLWIATWLLEGRWLQKPPSLLNRDKTAIPFLLFGLWFVWKVISGLWAADQAAWAWQMERYLSFGLIIPAGIWGMNQYYNWRTICRVFVISSAISVPIYALWMTALFRHAEWVPLLQLQGPWTQHSDWWLFVTDNFSHFKHRLFLCSTLLIAAVVALEEWRVHASKIVYLVPVLLAGIPLTGSRQAIIAATAIGIVYLICLLPKASRLRYGIAIVVAGIAIGGGILALHPRMQDLNLRDLMHARELSYYHDERMNMYGCALQRPSDYIAHGMGAGQSVEYMDSIYREKGFDALAQLHKHPHNQYLEELIEIGIPGLMIFLMAWLSIPFCTPRRNRTLAWAFVILFILNMFTDSMFAMFDGIALWAAGLLMISFKTDPEGEENTPRDT